MIAILNLLAMGAGAAGVDVDLPRVAGKSQTILESASTVKIEYRDLGVQTPAARGFVGYGTAEPRYRRTMTLSFVAVQSVTLDWIDIHYRAFLAGGGVPFDYALPKTTSSFWVAYKAKPSLNHTGWQGGNSATVVLEEVFTTD